jgi:hypothetical protein
MIRRKKKGKINSVSKTFDGIKFRSGLEMSCYKMLTEAGIPFEYESKKFLLQEGFTFNHHTFEKVGKKGMFHKTFTKIRKIEHTPDFIGEGFVIETKGFMRQSNANIVKMFKKHIMDNGLNLNYYLCYNVADIKKVIELIKQL